MFNKTTLAPCAMGHKIQLQIARRELDAAGPRHATAPSSSTSNNVGIGFSSDIDLFQLAGGQINHALGDVRNPIADALQIVRGEEQI